MGELALPIGTSSRRRRLVPTASLTEVEAHKCQCARLLNVLMEPASVTLAGSLFQVGIELHVCIYVGRRLTVLPICAAYSSWFPGGKWSLCTLGGEPGW